VRILVWRGSNGVQRLEESRLLGFLRNERWLGLGVALTLEFLECFE